MRKLASFLVVIIVIATVSTHISGCAGNNKSVEDTLSTDSIDTLSSTDSIDKIISEKPMPKAADELFDDFFFNFAGSKNVQKRRTKFPLQQIAYGKQIAPIQEANWKTEHFFMKQGFYTLILDNLSQEKLAKDTSINNVVVEEINLHKSSIKGYNFERLNGEWFLTCINTTGIKHSRNASFLTFYNRFSSDSAFHNQSIVLPLNFKGPNPEDEEKEFSGRIDFETYQYVAPELPTGVLYSIAYGQENTSSTHKAFLMRGISNGQECQLFFKKIGGLWKLYKLVE